MPVKKRTGKKVAGEEKRRKEGKRRKREGRIVIAVS